jgi:anthranilate phosphoribosyltransferase
MCNDPKGMDHMRQWIKAVGTGRKGSRDLTYDESAAVAHIICRKEATDAQIAAWLMAERMKSESVDEIMAFIHVFREYCAPIQSFTNSINCAGPYDGRRLFPVTIPVSLLMASVQVPQVLHGGDSLPPKEGTSVKELLEALGVNVHEDVPLWERIFSNVHINFVWTEKLCPPLGYVRHIREQMGLRTMLNTVEKVINPVQSTNLIIGVNHKTAVQHLIHILPGSGFETSYIIQGIEGSEDLPIYKNSAIRKVTAYGDESSIIDPNMFGFTSAPLEEINKEQQLHLLQRVIQGEDSLELKKERDHVIFNTGLRLFWFEKVSTYEEGFYLARSLLQRKEASKTLNKWIELSRAEEVMSNVKEG